MKERKTPIRLCVACRQPMPKKELLRIVRDKEGVVSVDVTGKSSGRGAYICKNLECLRKAQKARKLERAFSCRIDDSVYAQLEAELAGINKYGGAVYEES